MKKTLVSLTAPKARNKYKSDKAYIEAVYRKNKKWIDTKMTYKPAVSKKTAFVNATLDYVRQGKTARQAVNTLASSASFVSQGERARMNILKVIEKDKKLYRQFKEATKIKKKSDIDINRIRWSYRDTAYEYDGVVIDVSHSPYGIHIYKKEPLEEIIEDIFA